MEIALLLVALVVGVLVVTALADRIDVPAPLVLIVVGVVASFVPGLPEVRLEPEIVLLGLLPPLLYAAAIQTSLVDFNANRRPILLLSVGLVVFTTVGVGVLVHALLPERRLARGPGHRRGRRAARRGRRHRRRTPDRSAAADRDDPRGRVAAQRRHRAGLAAHRDRRRRGGRHRRPRSGGTSWSPPAGARWSASWSSSIVASVRKRITDPLMDTAISFVMPFAAYLAAEEIHASGVIAVVIAGLLLGHKAPIIQAAQSRIAERMNWRTIAFLLENAVFLLIGLQAKWIFSDVAESELSTARIVAVCGLTLVAVIALRLVWVFPARYLLVRPGLDPLTGDNPPWTYTFLLGWAGMRGVVTLAAAFIIPADTQHREVLLLAAFTVVAGTLLIQGLSLPALARRMRVPGPDPMDDALARATLLQQASKAGHEELDDPGVRRPARRRRRDQAAR